MLTNMDKLEWTLKEIAEWVSMKLETDGIVYGDEVSEKIDLALMDYYYTGSEDCNQETQGYIY